MACPFCGNPTEPFHHYCDQCGASLKSEVVDIQDEDEQAFFPSAIVYEGRLGLTDSIVFRSSLGEPLWIGWIDLQPSPLRLSFYFQTDKGGPLEQVPTKWKISYHPTSESRPMFRCYGGESELLGRIFTDPTTKGKRLLTAKNREGIEYKLWSKVGGIERLRNSLIQAGLYIGRIPSLWQGWESEFGFTGHSRDEDNTIPCGVSGDVTVPEYYVYRFQTLCEQFDYRLVLGLLGLQAFGLWDPEKIPEYVISQKISRVSSVYDLR